MLIQNSYSQGLTDQINMLKDSHKISKNLKEEGLNAVKSGMSKSEFNKMINVIKQLNNAELQIFQLNSLRRMIHLEFILNEQKHESKSTHSISDAHDSCHQSMPSKKDKVPEHFKDDELELGKFKEIWAKTVKSKISDKVMHQLYHAICDDKMEHVQFEKFNRLCDLFFFTPGKALKNKNDSNQLYQIMSSMQTDKAMVLTKKVSSIISLSFLEQGISQ